MSNYFRGNNNNCFQTSLANLLVSFGDSETANQIFKNQQDYGLILRDGRTFDLTSPYLVRKLTNEKYNANFFGVISPNWEEGVTRFYADKTARSKAIRRIEKEMQGGHILEAPKEGLEGPGILFVLQNYRFGVQNGLVQNILYGIHPDIDGTGHALAWTKDGRFIDSGYEVPLDMSKISSIGLVKVKRSNR